MLSAATGQGVASDLQYVQFKGKDKRSYKSRAQLEAFPEEHMALLTEKEIPKKGSLSKLCPWLDNQGVLRCGGRLQITECLLCDVRFPTILPRGQGVTKLVKKHYDELSNHGAGTNFVVSQISGRFWIVAAHEETRAWEIDCSECKRSRN